MKGDFSRRTHDRRKHYSAVLTEQGRLLTDADLDEEHRILAGHHEQVTVDVIGAAGGPLEGAGFEVTVDAGGSVHLSAGRYYVDGLLAECEMDVAYADQPHFPDADGDAGALPDGDYPVVLDVWRRLVTALDDPSLREVALGGPTTAAREQTIWQARILDAVVNWTCAGITPGVAVTTGGLAARATPEAAEKTPCLVPPLAGYVGLENQFYRVEVLRPGEAKDAAAAAVSAVTVPADTADQIDVGAAAPPAVGDLVELVRTGPGVDPLVSSFSQVTAVSGAVVTLATPVPALAQGESLGLRTPGPVAVFSRENGSVVAGVERIDGANVTVTDLGPDATLGFAPRQWVEITDDAVEFDPDRPRALHFVTAIDADARTVTLATPAAALAAGPDGVDPDRHPKLRRWDGAHGIWTGAAPGGWLHLESGIEVAFAAGGYVRDDHWAFPARTAVIDDRSGNIEWPQDAAGPASLPPAGIGRHRAALALLSVSGGTATVSDCRNLFPPLTELTNLFYVGGDGQEARRHDAGFPKLPRPLEVRVANGEVPVPGVQVRFTPDAGAPVDVTTDPDGIASFTWTLVAPGNAAAPTPPGPQVCTARLLDAAPAVIPNQVVRFSATVQDLTTLLYVGGDGQEARVGDAGFPTLESPLAVRVANGAHPVQGATVVFAAAQGAVAPATATTGADGVATAEWTLDTGMPATQSATARLIEPDGTTSAHQLVEFSARIDPESHGGGGCCVSIGEGGEFATIEEAMRAMRERKLREVCLCLLPGDHKVGSLSVKGAFRLCIRGCGRTARVLVEDRFDFHGLVSLRLADFDLRYPDYRDDDRPDAGVLVIEATPQVELDNVQVFGRSGLSALVAIRGAVTARVSDSVLEVPLGRRFRLVDDMFARLRAVAASNGRLHPLLGGVVDGLDVAFRAVDAPEFDARAKKLVAGVADLTPAARAKLVQPIDKWLREAPRGPIGDALERVAASLGADGDLRELPARIVEAARLVDTSPDFASGLVALEFAPADGAFDPGGPSAEIGVQRNTIYGDVAFHGVAARSTAGIHNVSRDLFPSGIKRNALLGDQGTVHVTGNHLGRLRVSDEVIDRLQAFAETEGERALSVFRSFLVSDNVFDAVDTPDPLEGTVIARHVAVDGNHFTLVSAAEGARVTRVLQVISAAATVTGNMGDLGPGGLAGIEVWSPRKSEAGNVDLVLL